MDTHTELPRQRIHMYCTSVLRLALSVAKALAMNSCSIIGVMVSSPYQAFSVSRAAERTPGCMYTCAMLHTHTQARKPIKTHTNTNELSSESNYIRTYIVHAHIHIKVHTHTSRDIELCMYSIYVLLTVQHCHMCL